MVDSPLLPIEGPGCDIEICIYALSCLIFPKGPDPPPVFLDSVYFPFF